MKFVDRRQELEALRAALGRGPALVRVYGRRRLGKTELLSRLCRDLGGIYLLVDEAEPRLQAQALGDQLSRALSRPPVPTADWAAFLRRLQGLKAPVVVLDEFQRLLHRRTEAESILQNAWDQSFSKRGPSLVLCGSSVGMMRRLTRRPAAPLYGRLWADLHLRPLDYASVRQLHAGVPEEDRVRRFAVFGGTPHYQSVAVGRPLEDAIAAAFLTRGAPLADEPMSLLRMEAVKPDRLQSVLQAVGEGTHALGALEAALNVPSGRLSPYIAGLRDELALLRAEAPVGGAQRRARYVFSDPFFAFYYRFVPRARPLVEAGRAADALAGVRRDLEAHVGQQFERVAAQALIASNGRPLKGVPIEFEELGRWWSRQGEEIDLVARGSKEVLAGEVKWSPRPLGPPALWTLEDKARPLGGGRPVRLLFVARGGFTRAMEREARSRGALLLDLEDLTAIFARAGRTR